MRTRILLLLLVDVVSSRPRFRELHRPFDFHRVDVYPFALMSCLYLIRSSPPSSTSKVPHQRANRPTDLFGPSVGSARALGTGLLLCKRDVITTFSDSGAASESGRPQDCWTVRLGSCSGQEARRAGVALVEATACDASAANVLARSSNSTDRLLIQSVKWFTLARCLFTFMQNWSSRVGVLLVPHSGRDLLAYPSDAHRQTRLMVAACVSLRVLSSHWSHLPVRLALTPTPRVELQSCCDG